MKNFVNAKFYLNEYKSKGNRHPIYLRLSYRKKKAEIATKYFLEPHEWNVEKERTKKNSIINKDLSDIENRIHEITMQLEKTNKPISAVELKKYLTKKEKFDREIIEFYDACLDRLFQAGEVEKVTVQMYGYTKNYLQKFLREIKGLEDFPVESINFSFLSDFDLFLRKQKINGSERGLERNTVNKHHSRLRTVLIRAMREGHIMKNPYVDFKLKKHPSKRTFLSEEELEKLTKHSLGGNESLIKVRDIFIFSVYTGLRFEDAQLLTTDKITTDKDGNYKLQIDQEKTNEPLMIPLFESAIKILKKYDNTPERVIFKKVLPKISNQKINSYLKVIADIVGIEKHLTHHVARHTCATTILLSNEAPIEVVSRWLGHTNIKTTQIYAKITNNYLQKIADKIEKKC
jgi:integrase/recombinase XerD